MRLVSAILFSGVVASAATGAAMAQDTAAQPPAKAQPATQGDHRGGPASSPQGGPGRGGAAARFGPRAPPAMGGVVGTVESVSASRFVISTAAGRKASVEKTPSTTFRKGKGSALASAVKNGESLLVLGMVDFGMDAKGTTIKASQITVQPADGGLATSSAVAGIAFQQGAPRVKRNVGQIPANYTEGSGTIIGGDEATKAIQAALAQRTGGIVNRVVKLSDGEYEVHNVGVNWPHHIFVNQDFKYVGAN